MANDENLDDIRLNVWKHIKEELIDLVDDGELTDDELRLIDDSMGETANIIMSALGLQIESVEGDKIHAVIRLIQPA